MVGEFVLIGGDFILPLVSVSYVFSCCCLDVRIKDGRVGGCGKIAMMFLDFMVPRSVMAGFSGRYPRIAGSIENISNVESLAKPASTLTRLTLIGIFFSQSKKISVDNSLALTSSKIRMLSRSLGYSGRSNSELVKDAAD